MVDSVMKSNTTRSFRQEEPSEIQQLKDTVRYLQQRNEVLEGDRNIANGSVLPDEDRQCELFLLGLNRYSVQSDDYHRENPLACKDLYRFESWEHCKAFIEGMFDVEYVPPTKESIFAKMSKFEQVMMTLMWIESSISLQRLSLIFGYKTK